MHRDSNNILYADNKQEYLKILEDSEKLDRMTKEQFDYEYSDHVIFENDNLCIFRYMGNTYYIGREFGDEMAEFYLKDFTEVHVEISTDKMLSIHWRDSRYPSIVDIIESEGFPIQIKLFKDYGQQ